jgi:hypothetical protein
MAIIPTVTLVNDTGDTRVVNKSDEAAWLARGYHRLAEALQPPPAAPVDYKTYLTHSLAELKELAAQRGIKVDPTWRRSDYAKALARG